MALPRNPGERGRTMTARKRLPKRRHAETFELTVGGLRYVCTVGRGGLRMARALTRAWRQDDNLRDLVPVMSWQDRLIPIMDILGCAPAFQN